MDVALSHVSIGANDLPRMLAFYDAVLAPLGIVRVAVEDEGAAVAYGRQHPEFWVQRPHDGGAASPGNGVHVGFMAADRAQVDAFHAAGLRAGAACEGPPGARPHYGAGYYGAFLRDPEGNKIEASLIGET